jgi:hypothetical protein
VNTDFPYIRITFYAGAFFEWVISNLRGMFSPGQNRVQHGVPQEEFLYMTSMNLLSISVLRDYPDDKTGTMFKMKFSKKW